MRPPSGAAHGSKRRAGRPAGPDWWRAFGSAGEFDRTIVGRMGRDFYREAFVPAMLREWKRGLQYVAIRDSIRSEWNRRRAEVR
jgi:hypothetical protein